MDAVVTGACESVMKALGTGHSEATYQAALEVELRSRGVRYESQRIIPITYKGHAVGLFRLDLVLAGAHVVELKTMIGSLRADEKRQLATYMRVTGLDTGYLVNFQQRLEGRVEVLRYRHGDWTELRAVHAGPEVGEAGGGEAGVVQGVVTLDDLPLEEDAV